MFTRLVRILTIRAINTGAHLIEEFEVSIMVIEVKRLGQKDLFFGSVDQIITLFLYCK